MKIQTQKTIAVFELAARVYLAYMLVEYGVSKLTGGMFNNASPQVLNTPLKDVDLFHLTWYWFYKNKLLTYFIGIIQIAAAALLLFSRTVIIGVLLALPVLFSILLVDIYCVGSAALIIRVAFYNLLLLGFIVYRWQVSKTIFTQLVLVNKTRVGNKPILLAATAGAVIVLAIMELIIVWGLALLAN
ncbi:hypothetical protein [Polluticoccus soli]|uniref:hypothetical protein n=1 Tax=Polluticoccus soli TaxID=3034150 RepID=UPI0023E2A1FB|nr:hypothetical protein [Flavipsychrobacter sp. JY13-12]